MPERAPGALHPRSTRAVRPKLLRAHAASASACVGSTEKTTSVPLAFRTTTLHGTGERPVHRASAAAATARGTIASTHRARRRPLVRSTWQTLPRFAAPESDTMKLRGSVARWFGSAASEPFSGPAGVPHVRARCFRRRVHAAPLWLMRSSHPRRSGLSTIEPAPQLWVWRARPLGSPTCPSCSGVEVEE